MKNKNKILTIATVILIAVASFIGIYVEYTETGKIDKDKVNEAVNTIVDAINTYEMTNRSFTNNRGNRTNRRTRKFS